jgi:diguanylate cyclase (GGDEF)-like protein
MERHHTDIPKILIVDDKPMNLVSLSAVIQQENLEVVQAGSGNEALSLILDNEFALILLDVQMPGMDGFETAELIRANPRSRHIPIIFVTAVSKDEQHLFKGYDSGAVDYLFKPIDTQILISKIRVFIDLYIEKKKSEVLSAHLKEALAEAESSRQIVDEQNLLLKELAIKDGLTGLYNHRHMLVIMDSEFNRAIRYKTDLSCLLMDIDFFKDVNDTHGHPFGDFVLKEFARSLSYHMRYTDYLFRYGGEEFLVLLPQTDQEGAMSTAEKFRAAMESSAFQDNENHARVTVSIGVASLYINQPSSYTQLITYADKALFTAKAQGRNRVVADRKSVV